MGRMEKRRRNYIRIYQFITIDGRTAIVRIQRTLYRWFGGAYSAYTRFKKKKKIQMTFDARGPATHCFEAREMERIMEAIRVNEIELSRSS